MDFIHAGGTQGTLTNHIIHICRFPNDKDKDKKVYVVNQEPKSRAVDNVTYNMETSKDGKHSKRQPLHLMTSQESTPTVNNSRFVINKPTSKPDSNGNKKGGKYFLPTSLVDVSLMQWCCKAQTIPNGVGVWPDAHP